MTATVVLLSLLLAPAASGSAAPPAACKTFTRSSETPPPLVREWFAHAPDERVVMCPQAAAASGNESATALYFGEGALTRHETVCTYPRHGLILVGSGAAARLERYDRSEALAMALADPECPEPHATTRAQGYIETYDISSSTFVGIMRLWSTIARSPPAASSRSGGSSALAAQTRLRAALGTHAGAATVTRVVRIPGSVLRHRYALFVTARDASSGAGSQYVIYLDKRLRGPYEVTAFTETN